MDDIKQLAVITDEKNSSSSRPARRFCRSARPHSRSIRTLAEKRLPFRAGCCTIVSKVHPQTQRSLSDARDFMRHAYAGPVRLADVSARANLSPYHFLRVHRQAFGETPHEFLTRVRIERAKTLLAGGTHNVTEACFEVGFSSLGSFSALFAQRVGLPPSEYRRHARAGILVPREVRPLFVPGCFAAMIFGSTERR